MMFGEYLEIESNESYSKKFKKELSFNHGVFLFEGSISYEDTVSREYEVESGVAYIEPTSARI